MALGVRRRRPEANRLECGWSQVRMPEEVMLESSIGYEVKERDEAQHWICQKLMTRQNDVASVCYDITWVFVAVSLPSLSSVRRLSRSCPCTPTA